LINSFRARLLFLKGEFAPGKIGELCQPSSCGSEKRIIFIETSGEKCLKPRQACAVESAARTNSDMSIYIFMAINRPPGNPEKDRGEGLLRNCQTMQVLRSFSNVYVMFDDLPKHLIDTPLETLYFDGRLKNSEYALQHISDALRVALLYKYGGIYLDLDVVVLRSLCCLRNTAGHTFILGESSIETGFMAFDPGHKFLKFFMGLMQRLYKPNERSVIGPNGFSQAFRLFCNHPSIVIRDSVYDFKCHNNVHVRLHNKTAFHPITYFEQNRFYAENFDLNELDAFNQSYSVHVYGSGHGAHVPKTSLFAFMANQFCPSTYGLHLQGVFSF
jgi:lactosylceramide 4-alpha-galactosyltransferase